VAAGSIDGSAKLINTRVITSGRRNRKRKLQLLQLMAALDINPALAR